MTTGPPPSGSAWPTTACLGLMALLPVAALGAWRFWPRERIDPEVERILHDETGLPADRLRDLLGRMGKILQDGKEENFRFYSIRLIGKRDFGSRYLGDPANAFQASMAFDDLFVVFDCAFLSGNPDDFGRVREFLAFLLAEERLGEFIPTNGDGEKEVPLYQKRIRRLPSSESKIPFAFRMEVYFRVTLRKKSTP